MVNKIRFWSICLLTTLYFSGCKESLPDEPYEYGQEETGEWPTGQNVFVAGFENIQDEKPVARLWKNGKMENLGGIGKDVRSSEKVIYSEARSVFVSGNDVYVAGYDILERQDPEGRVGRARLWKNGEMQELEQGSSFHQALSVFVSGDDVYVLGRESLSPEPSSSGRWAYKYWKNGKAVVFAEKNRAEGVNAIFVTDGGDVYVAGGYVNQAKLWKNGVEETLPGGSYANSVFVSGNDVYTVGRGTGAILWKNGKMEKLTNGDNNSEAFSVYVSGEDVYVSGYEGLKARLWKNGTVQEVADNKDAVAFLSVFESKGDVYTAGYVSVDARIEGNLHIPGYLKASVWRNGKRLKLDTGGKNKSHALSIFVK